MKIRITILFTCILVLTSFSFAQTKSSKPSLIVINEPIFYTGDFKAETFISTDEIFQINLPAHNYKSVKFFNKSEIQIEGRGKKYVWSNDDFQISVKIVSSKFFYDHKQPDAKEKFWNENNKQIKEYAIYEKGKIIAENESKTNDYLFKEFQISFPDKPLAIWRYYFTGTEMFSVNLLLIKNDSKESALKCLDSFKVLI